MELTIIVAIIAFLAVTLLLVGLLLFAKAKLTSSGEVTIDINDGEKVITAESGSTLLSTLANNKVFLPSACGGGGSCGMCKCQVLEGGGDILPTETGFISRKLAKDHWRLGCQVKVKENLRIKVPEAVLGVKKWECTVVSNRNISTFLKEFVVKLPEGENLKFRSGGYIQIDIPKYDAIKFSDMNVDEKYRADWDKFKMWDLVTTNPEDTFRAYSMANHLTSSGEVTIDINDGEKVITAESGSTLLSTLANNKVFLPSACGGGGSCGMCKCQVLEGGGDILPTETGFISRKLAKDHWRLGCQVKVKENLRIKVPEAVLGVKKWECTVVSNRNISTFLKEFVVKLPEGENLKFRSGGYIQIDIPKYDAIKFSDMNVDEKYRADWDKFKMWDLVTTNPEDTFRAYSMANHPAEGNIIMLNIRIATPPFDKATGGFMKVNPGICSSYVFSRKPGDKITISGPYG